jgi:hypothetical protein
MKDGSDIRCDIECFNPYVQIMWISQMFLLSSRLRNNVEYFLTNLTDRRYIHYTYYYRRCHGW